ncbi:hypothetical protein B4Q13_19185, partial [Lacticaseibacillus rhamnosus]
VPKHAISGLTASMLLDLRDIDICVTQIDIGNAATSMTAGFGHQTLQADGSLSPEPTFDVVHVARAVAHLVDLPLEVSVPSLTVMARAMRPLVDLMQWLWEEYQITISKQTLSREVRALDYRKLSARPRHHAQSAGVMDDFKKPSRICRP